MLERLVTRLTEADAAPSRLSPRIPLTVHALEPRILLNGATFYVDDDYGPATPGWAQNHFATIQEGIDTAADGDVVQVLSGNYVENIDFAGKAIVLTSQDPTNAAVVRNTVIDGGQQGSVVVFDDGEGHATVIAGFTITNGKAQNGGGIHCGNGSSPIVRSNRLLDNTAAMHGGALYCADASSPLIDDNEIIHNEALYGGGISCYRSSAEIRNNTISGNTAEHGGGVLCSQGGQPIIQHNMFSGNVAVEGGAIQCDASSPVIDGNQIDGNSALDYGGGIRCYQASPSITNNTIEDNVTERGGGILCSEGSAPTIGGNTLAQNRADEGAGVQCDGSSPVIRSNLFTSNVAQGHGGGIGCYESSPQIQGNTFLSNGAFFGGGLYCSASSSPLVEGNLIQSNRAFAYGGGIGCYESLPTITGNTVTQNSATERGGGVHCMAASPAIANSTISENTAKHGGGIQASSASSPVIENCYIAGNAATIDGGGIGCDNASPTIRNNTVSGNAADYGAGIYSSAGASPLIENNWITNNVAGSYGGGIGSYDSATTIVNTTVRDNSASDFGGGIRCERSEARIENCSITHNAADFGGGISCTDSSLTIDAGTITGNTSDYSGGGIYCYMSALSISACAICDNEVGEDQGGGGIYCNYSSPTITRTWISGNRAGYAGAIRCSFSDLTITESIVSGNSAGGIFVDRCSPTIANTVIAGNQWGRGAIRCYESSPVIRNTTIVGNAATADTAGAISCYGSSPLVTNCILWDNSPREVYFDAKSEPSMLGITYSLIEGGIAGINTNGNGVLGWGDGNLNEDPLFVGGPPGNWTGDATYDPEAAQSVLTDSTASWSPNALAGLLLVVNASEPLEFPIDSNTATTITVWGNVSAIAASGDTYQIRDYHPKSVQGHWRDGEWIVDDRTSPCVDAGDPTIGHANEPNPNGGRVNMGTYGNTEEASKSPATVAFGSARSSGSEDETIATVAVRLSVAIGSDVSVGYAVTGGTAEGGGVDYTLDSGTLIIPANETEAEIVFTVVSDGQDEFNESIEIALSNPAGTALGATTRHVYTILDADGEPTIEFDMPESYGTEADHDVPLVVRLSQPSGRPITVDYEVAGGTATGDGASADYTLQSGTLTFAPGEDTKRILIALHNDAQTEPDETVEISLLNPLNAELGQKSHVYTIRDDDSLGDEEFRFQRLWPTLQQPWWFNSPDGIAIDDSGNAYVVDHGNHLIQKLTVNGQLVGKWGSRGDGPGQFHDPHGIAVDSYGSVYVADTENQRIQKFSGHGEFSMAWGSWGSGQGEFRFPTGIAVGPGDSVYVADTDNHRVQKFSVDGQFESEWGIYGNGEGEFHSPRYIATDDQGLVYVVDYHRVQVFEADGTYVRGWGGFGEDDGQFRWPQGIAVDDLGFVYVSDQGNSRVSKFTQEGQFVTAWGEYGTSVKQFRDPAGVAVDENGFVYVVERDNHRVQRFTADGQYVAKWGMADGDGELNVPSDIALDGAGSIYVTDRCNNRVQKFTVDGRFESAWGQYGTEEGDFIYPSGVAVAEVGHVYVADSFNHRVQAFTRDGQFVSAWGNFGTGEGQLSVPSDVVVDDQGFVYVVEAGNHRVQKFTGDGAFVTGWGSLGDEDGQFDSPRSVWVDAEGFVYVVDSGNDRVQRFTARGEFVTKWDTVSTRAGVMADAAAIVGDGAGFLYVASAGHHRIQKFTTDGYVVTGFGVLGSDAGQLRAPDGLCIGEDGMIYVADSDNNRIQAYRPVDLTEGKTKAIVVAGGGPYAGNAIWDATQMCANFAYRALTYQGLTKEAIYYLSSDTDLDLDNNGEADDVDGDATVANLEYAITDWAADADSLVVYLVDHGGGETFRMSGTETLSASDLDSWLDELQQTMTGEVIVVYEACHSGSFLPELVAPPRKERIVIASASADEEAWFVTQGTISFSDYFWKEIFNGANVYDAFDVAKEAISYDLVQTPLLDDNGNGIGNDPDDGAKAEVTYIGNGTEIVGSAPTIGSVSDDQTIDGTSSATLAADGVMDEDGTIVRVWAVIRPPDYRQQSSSGAVLSLPSLDLMPAGGGAWEGTYDGFHVSGTYKIAIYARDQAGNTSAPKLTSVSVSNPQSRKAIVVAGGSLSDAQWPAIENCAKTAYEALDFQGYTTEDIYLIGPASIPGVDVLSVLPSKDNLEFAITSWATNQTRDVVLYLVGDGDAGAFQISEAEAILAGDLDLWLDELQTAIPGKVTVVYDGSCSGSFLLPLAGDDGMERIVISSTGPNEEACFLANGDISFSKYFWRHVANGVNVRDAFVHGLDALGFSAKGPRPQLDDNGDGIYQKDGTVARYHTLGVGIMLASDDPLIGSICPAQTLQEGTWARLWVDDVTTTGTIESVWAVITPPDYDPTQATTDPPVVVLSPVGDGRYEGVYDGFSTVGVYEVAIYAADGDGNMSLPRVTSVEHTRPDPYEIDDTYTCANGITVQEAGQLHDFHDTGDADWVMFYGVKGKAYEITTTELGVTCDTVIGLYGSRGTTLLVERDSGGAGDDEILSWHCPADGVYYVQIRHFDSSVHGPGTEYRLRVFRPDAPVWQTFIAGTVGDRVSGDGLSRARVVSAPGTPQPAAVGRDGTYQIPVVADVPYDLTASAKGYESQTIRGIRVPPGAIMEGVDFWLTPTRLGRRRPPSYTFHDSDGDEVMVWLDGPGQLQVTHVGDGGQGDIDRIEFSQTGTGSSLDIEVKETGALPNDGTTIGAITGSGIGSLYMPQVDLVGNTINLVGSLGVLTVSNIGHGSDIVLGGDATDSLSLWAQDIGDVDLEFAGVLASASAESWAGGTIKVNYVAELRTTMGDFGASLVLHGQDAGGWSLRMAEIAGDITGDSWNMSGDLGRQYRRRGKWRIEGLYCGGNLVAALTVGKQAWVIHVAGEFRGTLDIGSGFVGSADDRDLHTFSCDGDAIGTLTVHGNTGTLQFGNWGADTGQVNGTVQIDGSVDRMDAYGGTGAGGTITIGGDLGRQYRRRRRWRTEGLYCAGDWGAALTVNGQAWLIDVRGEFQGAVDVGAGFADSAADRDLYTLLCEGDVTGTLTVHGNAGTLQFGNWGADTGQVNGTVQIDGSVDRMDAYGGTGAGGTITIGGDLGRQYRRRRRWRTEGLYCAGEWGAALTVNGRAWLIDVRGEIRGAIDIGAGFVGTSDDRDLHTFRCEGGSTTTGALTVHGNAGTLQFGNWGADTGQINGAIQIDGSVDRIDAYAGTGAGGTITVGGDLGRQYRRRRRWRTEGLYCAGDLGAALTVTGKAWVIDIEHQTQGSVQIGGDLSLFACGGHLSGTLAVGGDASQIDVGGDLAAGIKVAGKLGHSYRRRGKRREFGVTVGGKFDWSTHELPDAPVIQASAEDIDGFVLTVEGDCYRDDDCVAAPVSQHRVTTDPATWLYWDPDEESIVMACCQ